MKAAELTGALLALWVAKAERIEEKQRIKLYAAGPCLYCETPYGGGEPFHFRPDSRWSDGGPIIEREKIDIEHTNWVPTLCYAKLLGDDDGSTRRQGPTPLIAAMRAYVASKFGDEVPDTPEAL